MDIWNADLCKSRMFHDLVSVQCISHLQQQPKMTSLVPPPTSHLDPDYDVLIQPLQHADGSSLVWASYTGLGGGTLQPLSQEKAARILQVHPADISYAMGKDNGFTFRTVVPYEHAHKQATAATAGKVHRFNLHTGRYAY